jgi:WD40 repeat protein
MLGARNVDLARGMVGVYGVGVLSVAFSPDGTRLATGGTDKSVVIWDVSASRPGRSS